MISQNSGGYNIEPYKKTASTPFARNDIVTVTAGLLVRATAATLRENVLGMIMRDVLVTDDDYAAEADVPVIVFDSNSNEFKATVEAGVPAQAQVGTRVDLNSENGINVGATAIGVFRVTKIISPTEVLGRFTTQA